MIRASIICATLASPVVAEGRDDPFMRCTFDDGRVVTLAEQGDGFEWREGSFTAPLVTEPQLAHDPVISFIGVWDDPERIDVFLGWEMGAGPKIAIGTALLSRTVISDAGAFRVDQQPGTCADYFG